jgi:hypothetical protein
MESARFDCLTRTLVTTPSRRGLLRLLGGAVIAPALARLTGHDTAAAGNCLPTTQPCMRTADCCGKAVCKSVAACSLPNGDTLEAGQRCCKQKGRRCNAERFGNCQCCGNLFCSSRGRCRA